MPTLTSSFISLFLLSASQLSFAGDVEILSATLKKTDNTHWSVNVTLKHEDSGWDHYADNWQIIDATGRVLGDRVLLHPHENEQPFTRGLSSVNIPQNTQIVYIKAHDKQHGWTNTTLKIDLGQAVNGHLHVNSQ